MKLSLIEEGKFKYIEKGSGKTILVLHGLMGKLSNFETVLNHFSKNYRIILPELPVYRLKVLHTTVKSLAKFIKDFMAFKEIDKAILLGNSSRGTHRIIRYKKIS